MRELLLAGDPAAAEAASRRMQGPETESYQPVGDLTLMIDDDSDCVSYEHWLDMETGVVTTSFALASGLVARREVFVRDGVITIRLSANRPVSMTHELTSPHPMDGNVIEAPEHVVGLMTSLTGHVSGEPVVYGDGMRVTVDIARSDDEVRVSMGAQRRLAADHALLMRRASVSLGEANEWAGELFDFGRYLLVSSSMPGTQPATLQGIWNVHRRPPWNANYTININTEMNYWSANVAHLPECNEPLFDLIEDLVTTGGRVAEVDYGAPGWVAHHNTDYWRHASAVGEGPSTSPENSYATDASISLGVTCDRVLARELFMIIGDEQTAARVPGEAIGRHGQIMEWFEDLDDPSDDHRHTSHLVGLFPGNSIDVDRTPDLAAAARRTLEQRGPGAQGWAILWRACLWARLRDGDKAWELLERLNVPCAVEPAFGPVGGRYPNSFLAHPPFQIDANLGFPAAIIELVVQSHAGYVHLLPALPRAIPEGEIRGVLTHGGHEVNLRWSNGALAEVEIATGHLPLHLRIADGPIEYDVADPDDVVRIRA